MVILVWVSSVPDRVTCLNAWLPDGELFGKGLEPSGDEALLKRVGHVGGP